MEQTIFTFEDIVEEAGLAWPLPIQRPDEETAQKVEDAAVRLMLASGTPYTFHYEGERPLWADDAVQKGVRRQLGY